MKSETEENCCCDLHIQLDINASKYLENDYFGEIFKDKEIFYGNLG